MNHFLRDFEALHRREAPKMAPNEVADLRFRAVALYGLSKLVKKKPKIYAKRPKSPNRCTYKSTKGVIIDGIRCCRLCKRPIPHTERKDRQLHMLAAKRRWMQNAAKVYWTQIGYDLLWKRSVPARRNRSVKQKTAIFRELAPRSAALMTDEEIAALALAFVNPKTGHMHGYRRWRTWIRRHYQ